jgi:hypothetical protein
MKLRPIHYTTQLSLVPKETGQMLILANELFAIYVLSGTMKIDFENTLSDKIMNTLLYSLRYRASSEDSLILFLAHLFYSMSP